MEWVNRVEPECFCLPKIEEFTGSTGYGVGSTVKCDCGRTYAFIEDEKGNQWWSER